MSEKTTIPDDIRGLIEQVDGELREAERLRNYANERSRQRIWPDRRRKPRIAIDGENESSEDAA